MQTCVGVNSSTRCLWPSHHGMLIQPLFFQPQQQPQYQQQQRCCRPRHLSLVVRSSTDSGSNSSSSNTPQQPQKPSTPNWSLIEPPAGVQDITAVPEAAALPPAAPAAAAAAVRLPALMDGINWYCYCCLGLLFLTDLTPLGQWLTATSGSASSSFPLKLAAVQWAAFVVPSLWWINKAGWDLPQTLKLKPCSLKQLSTALVAGPVLWLCLNAAIALRTGNFQQFTAAFTGDLPTAAAAVDAAVTPGLLLLGVGDAGGVGVQQAALLLLFAAASPAVAEELLFRGFLLTSLQQRLGNTDALAVAAALFAIIHLEPQQFFVYCVLGGACGLATVRSGSVWPAVVLHAAYNATAVAAALLLHR